MTISNVKKWAISLAKRTAGAGISAFIASAAVPFVGMDDVATVAWVTGATVVLPEITRIGRILRDTRQSKLNVS